MLEEIQFVAMSLNVCYMLQCISVVLCCSYTRPLYCVIFIVNLGANRAASDGVSVTNDSSGASITNKPLLVDAKLTLCTTQFV